MAKAWIFDPCTLRSWTALEHLERTIWIGSFADTSNLVLPQPAPSGDVGRDTLCLVVLLDVALRNRMGLSQDRNSARMSKFKTDLPAGYALPRTQSARNPCPCASALTGISGTSSSPCFFFALRSTGGGQRKSANDQSDHQQQQRQHGKTGAEYERRERQWQQTRGSEASCTRPHQGEFEWMHAVPGLVTDQPQTALANVEIPHRGRTTCRPSWTRSTLDCRASTQTSARACLTAKAFRGATSTCTLCGCRGCEFNQTGNSIHLLSIALSLAWPHKQPRHRAAQ